MTHITYKTAKRIKKFLGESAPEPMEGLYYCSGCGKIHTEYSYCEKEDDEGFPAYQLHDLLSKPFCEAFIKERFARSLNHSAAAWEVIGYIEQVVNAYYNGGLPAVEAALMEMMEAK